jgi:hypothetical protein
MLLPPGFADFHCTLLEVASARHSSAPTEADWIRWAGVAIAVAGALIATPDGTSAVWHWVTSAGNWIRDRLARFLPFLRRTISGEAKLFGDSGAGAEHMIVDRRIAWNTLAQDKDKIELLHQQVELLLQQVADVRQEIRDSEAALRTAIEQAEARLRDAHQELTGRLEAKERRAARVDARGIWPIGFGIVLTGLPSELADVAVVGWLFVAAGIALTLWMGRAVMTDQAI